MPLAEDYKALKKAWKTANKNKKNFPKAFADALATEKWKADGGHFSIEKKLKSMEKGEGKDAQEATAGVDPAQEEHL